MDGTQEEGSTGQELGKVIGNSMLKREGGVIPIL